MVGSRDGMSIDKFVCVCLCEPALVCVFHGGDEVFQEKLFVNPPKLSPERPPPPPPPVDGWHFIYPSIGIIPSVRCRGVSYV